MKRKGVNLMNREKKVENLKVYFFLYEKDYQIQNLIECLLKMIDSFVVFGGDIEDGYQELDIIKGLEIGDDLDEKF